MFGIAGLVDRETIIELQRPDGKIESHADAEVGRERVKGPFRANHERRRRYSMRLVICQSCLGIDTARHLNRVRIEIPRPSIDEPAIIKNRGARLLDDWERQLNGRTCHRLTAKRLAIRILRANIAE